MVFKLFEIMSLSVGDQCPECLRKNRRIVGDLEFDASKKLLVCSHCMNKFSSDGRLVK